MEPSADAAVDTRYRRAAGAYLVYGIVYLAGGLYLISQGVGVEGSSRTGGGTSAMVPWALAGLIPLVVIPLLLTRRWSVLGGWISRRGFAMLIALFLIVRLYKVGEVAVQGSGAVQAPWGGQLGFQTGAIAFLAFTLAALVFLLRAIRSESRRSA
jgi:hypothetical protein